MTKNISNQHEQMNHDTFLQPIISKPYTKGSIKKMPQPDTPRPTMQTTVNNKSHLKRMCRIATQKQPNPTMHETAGELKELEAKAWQYFTGRVDSSADDSVENLIKVITNEMTMCRAVERGKLFKKISKKKSITKIRCEP